MSIAADGAGVGLESGKTVISQMPSQVAKRFRALGLRAVSGLILWPVSAFDRLAPFANKTHNAAPDAR
jgi:hypothetical protein